MLTPVILAGGVGSRLWPLSRDLYPKQLLSITGGKSLLQTTLLRALQIPDADRIVIVCSQPYQFLIEEQLDDLKTPFYLPIELILEPVAKSTAPALALAALHVKNHPGSLMLALPADNLLDDATVLFQKIEKVKHSVQQSLLTFGVKPTYPETGFGYIEVDDSGSEVVPINNFVEKPELATAEFFCQQHNYYWNSGIFLFDPEIYLSELRRYAADIFTACERAWSGKTIRGKGILVNELAYADCPSISIDYAIMEKTQLAVMTRLETTWADLGSWPAVAKVGMPNKEHNVCNGDVVTINTRNCYLHSESRLLTAVGVENLVVVETADAVLVMNKSSDQDIKLLVEQLKKNQRPEVETHAVLYEPWGYYEVLCKNPDFMIRRISIKAHSCITAAVATNTFERWIILNGSVQFVSAGQNVILCINQFAEITPNTSYQFININNESIQLLCVQTMSLAGQQQEQLLTNIS